MKTLAQWLDRKAAGPAKRKRLPKVSARRKREGAIYAKLRREFLAAHPYCQAFIALMGLDEAALLQWGGWFRDVYGLADRVPASTDVHHKAGRYGGNYLNPATWLAVSRESHRRIHENPAWAKERGFLQ